MRRERARRHRRGALECTGAASAARPASLQPVRPLPWLVSAFGSRITDEEDEAKSKGRKIELEFEGAE